MTKRRRFPVRMLLLLLVCLIGIVVSLIFAAAKLGHTSPSELLLRFVVIGHLVTHRPPPIPATDEIWRQHVLDPIPESVANIKADRPSVIEGDTYTLRFNIERSDLALLIDSGQFQRVWNVKYENGCLFWAWDTWRGFSMNGVTISVYGSAGTRREPAWFRPELWKNPEAYAFRKEVGSQRITKVLLYNEKEGEAYFIVSQLRL
jgi:hypothetical protein